MSEAFKRTTRNRNNMNVLVACEYSGIVRDAFENAGWNAWSCDILPTESGQTNASKKHFLGDVRDLFLNDELAIRIRKNIGMPEKWDLLIGHPPCSYLSFAYTGKERYSIYRLHHKIQAYQFFLDLWSVPVEHICLENPMGYVHTGLLPYTQIVEPYHFGEPYKKRTCLWLKNLPKLVHAKTDLFCQGTEVEPTHTYINSTPKKRRKMPAVLNPFSTQKEKSKFHKGIATAMAEQWTEYLTTQIEINNTKTESI